jgi:hypothetical protein
LPVSFISCASEHVDNLGAYSIPSETGLLIPSDCNNLVKMTTISARTDQFIPQFVRRAQRKPPYGVKKAPEQTKGKTFEQIETSRD